MNTHERLPPPINGNDADESPRVPLAVRHRPWLLQAELVQPAQWDVQLAGDPGEQGVSNAAHRPGWTHRPGQVFPPLHGVGLPARVGGQYRA